MEKQPLRLSEGFVLAEGVYERGKAHSHHARTPLLTALCSHLNDEHNSTVSLSTLASLQTIDWRPYVPHRHAKVSLVLVLQRMVAPLILKIVFRYQRFPLVREEATSQ